VTRDELQRIIDVIVQELAAGTSQPPARCACHAVLADCCPDRLQGVLDAGATRVGLHATGGAPAGVASMIDHTLLKPDATRRHVEELCREAAQFKFATVCVNPTWVATCARLLAGSGVGVIDMVINVGALKSGDLRIVERDIEAVTIACREGGALSKVIIEAALLTDDEKVTACTLAKAACADYVKTSTGFGPGGATAADVALMRRVVGAEMGVKAAGGVRDLEGVKAMIAAGATRVGASAGVKIVQQARGER
jgi:deoxyribose-phosphate aldolase